MAKGSPRKKPKRKQKETPWVRADEERKKTSPWYVMLRVEDRIANLSPENIERAANYLCEPILDEKVSAALGELIKRALILSVVINPTLGGGDESFEFFMANRSKEK